MANKSYLWIRGVFRFQSPTTGELRLYSPGDVLPADIITPERAQQLIEAGVMSADLSAPLQGDPLSAEEKADVIRRWQQTIDDQKAAEIFANSHLDVPGATVLPGGAL